MNRSALHLTVIAALTLLAIPHAFAQEVPYNCPKMGGFLETEAPALGKPIAAGATLGRIIHPQTFEELEHIENPVPDGIMILSHLTRNVVQPGDYAYMVGTPTWD